MKTKKVIGRREEISLPDLDLQNVDAKVDTGAYTSALHCHDVELFESDGKEMVRFKLLDPGHPQYNHKEFELPVVRIKKIKSSSGHTQKRVIIKTTMVLYGKKYMAEFSLADRTNMVYPVLLGRKAISGKFIVDVSKFNISNLER